MFLGDALGCCAAKALRKIDNVVGHTLQLACRRDNLQVADTEPAAVQLSRSSVLQRVRELLPRLCFEERAVRIFTLVPRNESETNTNIGRHQHDECQAD